VDRFREKVAVVTGSASGLGRAMAERCSSEGMTTVIVDNRILEAERVAREINDKGDRAIAMEVDVTRSESVLKLADRVDGELGGASLLINNAGVVSYSPLLRDEERGWRWIVDVNLFGVVHGVQAFVPRMLRSGRDCHVVNTSSLAGVVGAGAVEGNRIHLGTRIPEEPSGMVGYMATKHAVVAISETLAGELSGTRVGVSVLCPSHHENTGIFDNSAQFRPEAFGGPMTSDEYRATVGERQTKSAGARTSFARYPDECAARVLRAIRERHFFIFTHPENRSAVERRFSVLRAGFDDADSFAGLGEL
jgi:NAD(P)-dependent dehydrogenase (short-subunit alcohol dehydrogenase family)